VHIHVKDSKLEKCKSRRWRGSLAAKYEPMHWEVFNLVERLQDVELTNQVCGVGVEKQAKKVRSVEVTGNIGQCAALSS
jgi:hypothetical protein